MFLQQKKKYRYCSIMQEISIRCSQEVLKLLNNSRRLRFLSDCHYGSLQRFFVRNLESNNCTNVLRVNLFKKSKISTLGANDGCLDKTCFSHLSSSRQGSCVFRVVRLAYNIFGCRSWYRPNIVQLNSLAREIIISPFLAVYLVVNCLI